MLYTYLFSFGCANRTWNMDELSLHIAFIVDFFSSEVCFSWEPDLVSFLYFDDYKDWQSVVSTHDLVDLNIILF